VTLQEAKDVADKVVTGQVRSYVTAASELARFVLALKAARPISTPDEGLLRFADEDLDEL
jgi:hypothetical protein